MGGTLDFSYWILDGPPPVSIPYVNTYSTSFTPAGQHTIQYIVETEYGCLDTTSIDTVDVVDIPICNFEVNDTLCVNDTTIYVDTNLSTGYILNYEWNIYDSSGTQLVWTSGTLNWVNGGANIPAFPELFQAFTDTNYIISLTVSNCCGSSTCTDTIVIQPLPIIGAGIYTSPNYIATNNTTTINLNSYIDTINTSSITIDWGDPANPPNTQTVTPNTSQPYWPYVTHTYPNTGTFIITITASNNCGSTDTTLEVEVVGNALYSDYIPPPPACVGEVFLFEETSFPHPNTEVYWCFDWNPSTGSCAQANSPLWIPYVLGDIVTHTYTDPGEYLVYHKVQDMILGQGFADTTVHSVVVHPKPSAVIDSCENICQDVERTWTHSSWIDSLSTPNYTQQIIGTNWYIYDDQDNPLYNISSNNLTYTFSLAGNYKIILELTSNNNCVDYDTCLIEVYELPQADFSIIPDSSCLGNGLTYFDGNNSSNGSGIINLWEWDFTSNAIPSTGNGVLTSAEFLVNGNWLIDLVVTDNFGCNSTVTDTVIINNSMTAFFTSSTECFGTPTLFNSSYPLSSPNANSWFWEFGDGNISTEQNPTHIYNSPGNYLVTLSIFDNTYSDSTDCMDIWTDTAHVYTLPIAGFTTDTVCWQNATQFTDNSTIGEPGSNLLFTRDWYFDADNTIDATTINPSNIFDTCGLDIYNVTLGVYDNNGCYDETTESITISCPPVAGITIDTVCFGESTLLESTSIPGTFSIVNYQWYNASLGNYFPTSNTNIDYATYVFANIGIQDSSQLIIADPFGCSDTVVAYAYVRDNPNASFYTIDTNYCQNTPINFFEESFTTGNIQVVDWTFQNGTPSTSTINNPTVSFLSYGNWMVELYVEDEFGCYDDTIAFIEIDNLPNVDFSWVDACADTSICFTDLSTQSVSGNPLMQWDWDFGDGLNSDNMNPCHPFDSVNEFTGDCIETILTITDSLGCTNSQSYNTITIHPLPNVMLSVDSGICQGDCFIIENFTQFITDPCISDQVSNLIWYFNGDSISVFDSTNYCPPFNLPTETTHYFTLEVFTNWGCSYEETVDVEYWKIPSITRTVDYPNGQCGDIIPFDFSMTTDADSTSVSINDPEDSGHFPNSPYINNPNFSVNTNHVGVFNLNIYLENYRCSINDTLTVKAFPNPVANFSPMEYLFCFDEDTIINFEDLSYIPNKDIFETYIPYSTDINSWKWNLDTVGSNDIIILQNPSALFYDLNNSATEYITHLIVETNYGCIADTHGTITVLPTPKANFVTPVQDLPNYGTYLLDGTISTTSSGGYANPDLYNYEWIIDDGPNDIVNIYNSYDSNGNQYLPSPDSLYYQFNYFLYGENDYTKICLEVSNKLNIPLGLVKECISDNCKPVKIEAWGQLFVPNALYPESGDEGSSLFLPKGKSLIEYNLQIFDKFGNLLWENDELNINDGSPKVGWDGTSNGTKLPQGTYVWKIKADFINGPWHGIDNENKKTGVVYLIR